MCKKYNEQLNFVDFLTAVEAYKMGKTIYSYHPNGTCYSEYFPKFNQYEDLIFNEIEVWEILEGKWVIKN